MKKELFANQETISIMSQEKEARNKFYKTRKDRELEKVIALENKVKVLDDIVYKTGKSVQTMNMLNRNCKTSFVKPEDLKKAQRANPCLYDIGCYNNNLTLMLAPESDETIPQLQDKDIAISELKKLIEKMKGKSVETKFEKPSVIRQPNAFKSQRQSVLGKPATFSYSLAKTDFSKSKSVTTNNVSNDFSKPVTAQILPQNMKAILKNTNVIVPGISQLKSNRLEDRVMHNNSEEKKQQVEDHHRNFKFSNNKMSVTACNDSLNTKTSNVNFVCITYGKCVLNDHHDICVLHYINGVDSRTKMPMDMPISTREPKTSMNQSVAAPIRRTIASESTNQKSRSTIKKLYEHVSKTCSWWYSKITPPGYKWKPKTSTVNVKPNVSMPLGNKSRTTTILEPTTLRKSTISNTPSSFNSFAARTVKFGNDQIAPILGYGDLVQGNITIKRGNDLLTGSRGSDLYSITLQDTTSPNPICLMAKATSSQAWLCHHHLSHLNFDSINLLSKNDIVIGLPKDGENLDKMKEKGDACIFVGYSPTSRGYRVYNKRTRLIVETIHVNFHELPLMASDHVTETVTMSNKLDLLFSLMFDKLLNGNTPVVSKSFAVYAADAPNQRQQQHTTPSTLITIAADTPTLNI
ncbi:retrovirus-related pol polyprotein from transposon TNT 1-94 [Tanacetum coccineum]